MTGNNAGAGPPPPDPARTRFFAIQGLRWSGLALVMLGLLAVNRRIDLPDIAGYALFAIGLAAALVMPSLLARRWKTPKQ